MVKNYEYTYLTRQDMSEETAKDLQNKISEAIIAKQGAVVNVPRSYKKRLAYKIKKQEAAYVNTIMFTLDTEKQELFKKETDIMPEILRGLIVSYDPKKLEREARREPRSSEDRNQESTPAVIVKEAEKPVAVKEEKIEEPKVVLEEKKEVKAAVKEIEETKEVKEEEKETKKAKKEDKPKEKEEKAAEEKTAKPKRRTKIKTELKDIEQKLDEILK